MNQQQFITEQIKAHLLAQGLDAHHAQQCANQGFVHYQKRGANSRDPFKMACDYAGLKAQERCLRFKYQSPQAARGPSRRGKSLNAIEC